MKNEKRKKRVEASAQEKINAVRAVIKKGKNISEIADIFNRSPSLIRTWIKRYRARGVKGLDLKKRSGRPKLLTYANTAKLKRDMQHPASKFGFETDLWILPIVMQHIKNIFNINLSKTATWTLLNRMNMSSKKPEKRYYEGNIKEQKKFKEEELPKIKEKARKLKAKIYFMDEANIQLSPTMGRTWSEKGKRIVLKTSSKRGSISAISAVSDVGKLAFSLHRGTIKSKQVIAFLKKNTHTR